MESFTDFIKRINNIVDTLNIEELKELHNNFIEKKIYGKDFSPSEVKEDIEGLKKAVKIGIQKLPIEELKKMAPPEMVIAIDEFISKVEDPAKREAKPQEQESQRETKKSLLQEAIQISKMRNSQYDEIPKEHQERLGYVLSKLHVQFGVSRNQLAELTGIARQTTTQYIELCSSNNPDLLSMWRGAKEKAALDSADFIPKDIDKSLENISGSVTAGLLIEDAKDIGRSVATQRQELGKYVMEIIGPLAQQYGYTSYIDFLKLIFEFFTHNQGKLRELEAEKTELLQINQLLQDAIEDDIINKFIGESVERVTVAALLGGGNINIDSLTAYKELLQRNPKQFVGYSVPVKSNIQSTVVVG